MSESSDLQQPAQKYLNSLKIKYIHLQKTTNRYYDTNKTLKGTPDLIVFIGNGKTLFFEFKTKGNKLSKEQLEWQSYFHKNNYFYMVIYNIQDFIKIINNYIEIQNKV
jgi:hypothetical protein